MNFTFNNTTLTDLKDLMFLPMSVTYTKNVEDQVRILEARHSMYVNDQNKNLVNVRIEPYLIDRTAVICKENLSG